MGYRDTDIDKLLIAGLIADAVDSSAPGPPDRHLLAAAQMSRRQPQAPAPRGKRRLARRRWRLPTA